MGADESPRVLFARRFAALYEAAGSPTLSRVSAAANARFRVARGSVRPRYSASIQRISDWRAGRNVPADFETLWPVLLTLIESAKRSAPVDRSLVDLREWRRVWRSASSDRSKAGRLQGTIEDPSIDAKGRRVFRVGVLGPTGASQVRVAVHWLRHEWPDVAVHVIQGDWTDFTVGLGAGRVDVAFTPLPLNDSGLQVETVHTDPNYLAVRSSDELADATEVRMADLGDRHGYRVPESADRVLRDYWYVGRNGPVVRSLGEMLHTIRWGDAVGLVPSLVVCKHRIDGLTYRPILDAPDFHMALAWRRGDQTVLNHTFLTAMRESARKFPTAQNLGS